MKKILCLVLASFLFVSSASALTSVRVRTPLQDSSGNSITNLSLTNGVAVYSEALYVADDIGTRALLVTENAASELGDVDISVEYSIDGTTFYTAYTTSGGSLTADSALVIGLQNTTRYILFTARVAPYMRFKFDPDADSRISASFIFLRDR